MVKTYADAIVYCENYGYSNEFYELMKEAAQLDLMNRFICNQQYLREEATINLMTESADVLDGYFSEAVQDNQLYNLEVEFIESAGDVLNKALSIITKPFRWLISLFRNLLGDKKKKAKKEKAKEIIESGMVDGKLFIDLNPLLNKVGIDGRQLYFEPVAAVSSAISDAIDNAAADAAKKAEAKEKGSGAGRVAKETLETVKAVFSNSVKPMYSKVMDLNKVISFADWISNNTGNLTASQFKQKANDVLNSTGVINTDNGAIRSMLDQLQGAYNKIEAAIKKEDKSIQNPDKDNAAATDVVGTMNKLLQGVGETIKYYTNLDKVSTTVCDAVVNNAAEALKGDGDATADGGAKKSTEGAPADGEKKPVAGTVKLSENDEKFRALCAAIRKQFTVAGQPKEAMGIYSENFVKKIAPKHKAETDALIAAVHPNGQEMVRQAFYGNGDRRNVNTNVQKSLQSYGGKKNLRASFDSFFSKFGINLQGVRGNGLHDFMVVYDANASAIESGKRVKKAANNDGQAPDASK